MEKSNLPAVIQAAITEQKIDLNKVNLMLPTESFGNILSEYDKVTLEVVMIDANSKDVYSIKYGENTLGKRPLMAISNALGLVWDAKNTGIIESTDMKSRAKVTALMRKANGEWIVISDEKTVDVSVFEREQQLEAKKGKRIWDKDANKYVYIPWKNEDEKEIEIEKAIIQALKFKDEKAMTGAMERVIRKIIAIKDTYTKEELSKPFVFPRVTLDIGKMLQDPKLRQAAIDRMTGSSKQIFGSTAEPVGIPAPAGEDQNCRIVSGDDAGVMDENAFDFPATDIPEEDPMAHEYNDLRKWIENASKEIGGKFETSGLEWLQKKESENIDNLRDMKNQIESILQKKRNGGKK